MRTISWQQMSDELNAFAKALPRQTNQVLADHADRVADETSEEWPVDTGRSAEAWEGSGTATQNLTPYASDVHNGLAYRLIPEVSEKQDQTTLPMLGALLLAALER